MIFQIIIVPIAVSLEINIHLLFNNRIHLRFIRNLYFTQNPLIISGSTI